MARRSPEPSIASTRPAQDRPTFTVVVPTHNRPADLARCLDALAALDYPNDRYDAIVVEDGSDTARRVVAEAQRRMSVRLVTQPQQGPAAARNRGATEAEGEFVAFVDDDCVPEPGWLRAFVGPLGESIDAAIGGKTINACEENLYSEATQLVADYLTAHGTGGRPRRPAFFASCNLAVTRDSFLTVGGFDSSFPFSAGEDREFCARWLASGRELVFADGAVVDHFKQLSLSGFWRTHFRYGQGAARFRRARARAGAPVSFERGGFYLGLVGSPLSGQPVSRRAVALVGLLVLSQLANALGFVNMRISELLRRSRVGR